MCSPVVSLCDEIKTQMEGVRGLNGEFWLEVHTPETIDGIVGGAERGGGAGGIV